MTANIPVASVAVKEMPGLAQPLDRLILAETTNHLDLLSRKVLPKSAQLRYLVKTSGSESPPGHLPPACPAMTLWIFFRPGRAFWKEH